MVPAGHWARAGQTWNTRVLARPRGDRVVAGPHLQRSRCCDLAAVLHGAPVGSSCRSSPSWSAEARCLVVGPVPCLQVIVVGAAMAAPPVQSESNSGTSIVVLAPLGCRGRAGPARSVLVADPGARSSGVSLSPARTPWPVPRVGRCRAQARRGSVLDVWRSELPAAEPRVHRCGVTARAGAFVRPAAGGIKEASRTCLPPGVSESAFVAESS